MVAGRRRTKKLRNPRARPCVVTTRVGVTGGTALDNRVGGRWRWCSATVRIAYHEFLLVLLFNHAAIVVADGRVFVGEIEAFLALAAITAAPEAQAWNVRALRT